MKSYNLDRLTLIREVYRSLLNNGRSYAAFERDATLPLVGKLSNRQEILDPMSGYGTLLSYCSEIGIRAYCVEICLPLYLWQVLTHPANSSKFLDCIHYLQTIKSRWPKTRKLAIPSQKWFPEESLILLGHLYHEIETFFIKQVEDRRIAEQNTLAFLIPFAGRLSSSVPSDISSHVKLGGICVYNGWHDDFTHYLISLQQRLQLISSKVRESRHKIYHGDCRDYKFPKSHFKAMITSPPYPNHRDLTSAFAPEINFLRWLYQNKLITLNCSDGLPIGSNYVAGHKDQIVTTPSAKTFLETLNNFKGSQRAKYDIDVYYTPYFTNYFSNLEKGYTNISYSIASDFEGYVFVVDNTVRDQVIPVAKIVMEIWRNLGFNVELMDSKEVFHVGTKNPRARGFKAKHMKHLIKISRNP
jgi:hypothetical protein